MMLLLLHPSTSLFRPTNLLDVVVIATTVAMCCNNGSCTATTTITTAVTATDANPPPIAVFHPLKLQPQQSLLQCKKGGNT